MCLLFMAPWSRRGESARWFGQGSCTEAADCSHDQCEQDGGTIPCGPISNIRERIATFQLIRGDYAWMGYSWSGCAGVDHRRPWQINPQGSPCFFNSSLNCTGYVDGSKWLPPKRWDPNGAMELDFGADQKPVDAACRETSAGSGVFERRYATRTVRLDCNTFKASFPAAENGLPRTASGGGYGGRGTVLPGSGGGGGGD